MDHYAQTNRDHLRHDGNKKNFYKELQPNNSRPEFLCGNILKSTLKFLLRFFSDNLGNVSEETV